MEDKQNNTESAKEFTGDLPIHFRLMDVFLEQVEQSTPLLATMVRDIQASYLGGVHMVLKAGESLENRSKMNVKFFQGVSNTFDTITPVIAEAQLGVAKAIANSASQSARLLRKSITGRK